MKKVFPLELEEDLHRQLKHAAIDSDMSLHAWIVKVLTENVNHKETSGLKSKKRKDDRKPENI